MATSHIGHLFAGLAMVMLASNVVVTKLAMARLALGIGFIVTVLVNVVFCALAFGVQLAWRETSFQWDGFAFGVFLAAGMFSTYFGRFFFFEAIRRLGPARASAYQLSSPLFAALIGWMVLGEDLDGSTLAAMLVTLYGIYLVSQGSGRSPAEPVPTRVGIEARTEGGWSRMRSLARSGMALAMVGSLAYAISTVMRAAAVRRWDEPLLGALLGAASGLVLHLATSRETRNLFGALKASDRHGLALYVASGVLTSTGHILGISSMAFIPAAVSALITLCSPILVLPLSYWLFRNEEGITTKAVLGTLLSLGGAAVIVHVGN